MTDDEMLDVLGRQRVLFGLEAQGYIPTVERMLGDGASWGEIGFAIRWCGRTAKDHYLRHLYRKGLRMKIEMVNDRLLVRPLEAKKVSKGGIILPDSAAEPSSKGVVVQVGPGRRDEHGGRHEMPFAVGDVILFGQYSGKDVEVGGEEFKVLREDDVIMKLDQE